MSDISRSLLNIPVGFLELGLTLINNTVKKVQNTIESLSGQGSDFKSTLPPVNGPTNLDSALSDFANQLIRIGRITPLEGFEMARFFGEVLRSARGSFGYVDVQDPRSLALCLAFPLSATGLMTETMLRGLVYYTAVGRGLFLRSTADVIETFSEVRPFISLQYKELIEWHQERLARCPGDSVTRAELGRIYTKCGRYEDAVRELNEAARDPRSRAVALHDSAVAHHRAGRFRQALEDGVAALQANPDNERARFWLWLSAKKLGGYPDSVPVESRMAMQAGHEPTELRYEDIAPRIGLDKTSGGRGVAVFDYNNDGLLDIVVTSTQAGCSLYRNNGDGSFTDVSIESGLDRCVNSFAVIAGDYDNDGFVDLFITRLGFYSGDCVLYHNNGDGTFTDVTRKAGLQIWGPAWTAGWADYDLDGYLDLFVVNNLGGIFDRHLPNRLFHNNGDGTFSEVTEKSGIRCVYPTLGSCWGDYNNDGYPDLFLSGVGRPMLFRNNGNGTFTDVSIAAGFSDLVVGATCCFADYDNDGWLDIVQHVWSEHEDVIHTMKTGHARQGGQTTRVYHNNRDGTFRERSREIGIDGCWGTMSGAVADVNNDGFLDLLLGNGGPRVDRLEPLVLLENDGGRFHNVTFTAGLPAVGKNHGTNCADLFGDGRLSIIIGAGGLYPGDLLTTPVYYPKHLPGNYINVRLKGTNCNRDAIGARITLIAGELRQMREVSGGTNFGCLPAEQHFGLGSITVVDALEIRWPGGALQRIENPPVNQTIRVIEGHQHWEYVYQRAADSGPGYVGPSAAA